MDVLTCFVVFIIIICELPLPLLLLLPSVSDRYADTLAEIEIHSHGRRGFCSMNDFCCLCLAAAASASASAASALCCISVSGNHNYLLFSTTTAKRENNKKQQEEEEKGAKQREGAGDRNAKRSTCCTGNMPLADTVCSNPRPALPLSTAPLPPSPYTQANKKRNYMNERSRRKVSSVCSTPPPSYQCKYAQQMYLYLSVS